MGGILLGGGRRCGGNGPGLARVGVGALHLLSADVGNPLYYIGVVLVVVGSWIWVALMSINLAAWKRDSRQAGAAGNVRQCRRLLSLGLDRGRRRARNHFSDFAGGARPAAPPSTPGWRACSFSWTLHAIVYFWLIPTYIAYYSIFPRAIGGRLYSDAMARISFILFVVVAMPIGVHHLFTDPQVGAGFKFIHSVFTAWSHCRPC